MRLARNSTYTLIASAISLVFTILTLPLFVSIIGAGRYGLLAIGWLALGYFGAADFGIGRAITQRIASMGDGQNQRAASAVWSALISMSIYGAFVAVLLGLFSYWYFSGPLQTEPGLRAEAINAVWVLALCIPVVTISGVCSGALMGLERFRLVAISNGLTSCGLVLLPLATAAFFSTDLVYLIASALAARLAGGLLLFFAAWRTFLNSNRFAFDPAEMRGLANFGVWIMVSSLIGPLMLFADRFIIGGLLDAIAIAVYTIPFQIATRTLLVPTAITQALFPRFASEDPTSSHVRCGQFSIFIAQLFAPVIIVLICLAEPLLSLWLGNQLDERSVIVAQIVLVGCWFNAVALVPFSYIQARGHPRFTALLHAAELPVYLVLLWQLGTKFGLAGFALAFAVRCGLDCFALLYRAKTDWAALTARTVGPAILIASAFAVGNSDQSWLTLLMAAILLSALTCSLLILQIPSALRPLFSALPLIGRPLGNVWARLRP